MIDAERFPRLAARLQMRVPKEKVAQIHEFATDLAVGFNEGVWSLRILPARIPSYIASLPPPSPKPWSIENLSNNSEPAKAMRSKWSENNHPDFRALVSFGYFIQADNKSYILTEKALRLADAPATPPNVFISYKRSESSAFALLLEARIKYETTASPYLDKSIELGDDWHARLEEKVKASKAFVCIIAPTTLKPRDDGSKSYVLREIEWALASEKTDLIIPVWHHGYDGKHENDIIKGKNAEPIESESAKNYDTAVNQIMNRLGYSPQFRERRRTE